VQEEIVSRGVSELDIECVLGGKPKKNWSDPRNKAKGLHQETRVMPVEGEKRKGGLRGKNSTAERISEENTRLSSGKGGGPFNGGRRDEPTRQRRAVPAKRGWGLDSMI